MSYERFHKTFVGVFKHWESVPWPVVHNQVCYEKNGYCITFFYTRFFNHRINSAHFQIINSLKRPLINVPFQEYIKTRPFENDLLLIRSAIEDPRNAPILMGRPLYINLMEDLLNKSATVSV